MTPLKSACNPGSSPAAETVRFVVRAVAEPGALSRLLEHLALRSRVPDRVAARREGQVLDVEIAVTGLGAAEARLVAAKLEALFVVDRVLLELEGQASARPPA